MRDLISLLWLLCLAALAAAADEPITSWTVANIHRHRTDDGATCHWTFLIIPDELDVSAVHCEFDVSATPAAACDRSAFSDVICADDVTTFVVGGGWSDQEFTVMTMVNYNQQAQAYFGFADIQLNTGAYVPAQRKPAYRLGSQRRAEEEFGDRLSVRDVAVTSVGRDMPMWTLKEVHRVVYPPTESHNQGYLDMHFIIEEENGEQTPCQFVVEAAEGVDIEIMSWYDQKCWGGVDWYASWGFVEEGDGAVMTLVPPSRDLEAFFGWNNINGRIDLEASGPNPATPCECGGNSTGSA